MRNECLRYCRCYWHSFHVPHIFWIVVEKYQDPTWGTQNFTTINFFWFYSWLTKGLFRNPLWSLLLQLISKSIDISTFYNQRGSDWCIYSLIRKVGHILYALSKMWPHVPHGPQGNPVSRRGTRDYKFLVPGTCMSTVPVITYQAPGMNLSYCTFVVVRSTQYAVRCTLYAVRSTQYAVRSTQYEVRSTHA